MLLTRTPVNTTAPLPKGLRLAAMEKADVTGMIFPYLAPWPIPERYRKLVAEADVPWVAPPPREGATEG